jgi:hypothetical protein
MHKHKKRQAELRGKPAAIAVSVALATMLNGPYAQAFEIETANSDLHVLWDTTVKYSTAWRLKNPSATLTAPPFPGFANTDDGDRNFKRGLISNRLDILSELDISYKGFGGRLSGAAWYDSVYNQSNDNDSPATANQISVPYNDFTRATEKLHGRKAELLDAFVFGKADLGESKATFRVGKHTMLWGESLFFGANGIANGQGPIDVVKAVSVPNTQFKELMRPVQQVSGQLQINPNLSVGAYYQWRWEKLRLPGVGSYYSFIDFVPEEGSERLIVGPAGGPFAAPIAFFHGNDQKARNSGQGGVQARFRVGEVDYGVYAIRYHDKAPQIYLRPGGIPNFATGQIGEYLLVYPENIKSYGASATTTVGQVNFAAEVSIRRNTPLDSDAQLDLAGTGDNRSNPLYAVGNSAHAQLSWLASLGPSFISREADFLGEIAWNRRTSITKNPSALNVNADRDATNIRMVYEPKYRQVWPGVDLSVPIGIGYGISGNSSVVGAFNGEGVGDVSIGVSGAYLDVWRFGLNYTHYFGPEGTFIDATGHRSFKQSLADRDFISVTFRRTF